METDLLIDEAFVGSKGAVETIINLRATARRSST